MRLQSIRSKLLVGVSALIIGSGMMISLLVTHRYCSSLLETIAIQAESIAHTVVLEAADKILINDLSALQSMLDRQVQSNPAIAYLFVSKKGRILAQSFTEDVPSELLNIDVESPRGKVRFYKNASTNGEHYLDIVLPIFSENAGMLRLGFSENSYRHQVRRLWQQIGGVSLGILFPALLGTLFFVGWATRPLTTLARAIQKIDKRDLNGVGETKEQNDVASLASLANKYIQQLEETKDYLTDILENTEDSIITSNLDGKVVSFNHGGEVLLGYDRHEVIGKSAEMFYPDPEVRRALIKRVMKDGSVPNYETKHIRKDGHIIEIALTLSQLKDKDGRCVGTVGISKDITQRKRLEEELIQSHWRFKRFVELAHEIISIKDLQGRYQVINPQAARLFNMNPIDCIGKTDYDLLPANMARLLDRKDKKIIETGTHLNAEESLVINGKEHYFDTLRFPLQDYKGDTAGVCLIGREVTKQKELQNAVIQSEKMAAVGKLAAAVAHEINNPLTGILTFSEELKRDADPNDPIIHDYDIIVREAMRCRQIVRDLLDFARLEKPKRVIMNINRVIERSLDFVQRQAPFQDVKFELSLSADLPDINIDPNQMQQVFLNLIINAGEAMDASGKITLQSRVAPDSRSVEVAVKDRGCGIPDEKLSQIFEPFYSTKGQKGNGLGLSVVRTIIDQHGGRIRAESEAGIGTTFHITLPMIEH